MMNQERVSEMQINTKVAHGHTVLKKKVRGSKYLRVSSLPFSIIDKNCIERIQNKMKENLDLANKRGKHCNQEAKLTEQIKELI